MGERKLSVCRHFRVYGVVFFVIIITAYGIFEIYTDKTDE